jgi:thioredoxin-related protein
VRKIKRNVYLEHNWREALKRNGLTELDFSYEDYVDTLREDESNESEDEEDG